MGGSTEDRQRANMWRGTNEGGNKCCVIYLQENACPLSFWSSSRNLPIFYRYEIVRYLLFGSNFTSCFFFRPTELDALVYGHLFSILTTPLPDNRMAATIRNYKNLVELCKKIDKEFFDRLTNSGKEGI